MGSRVENINPEVLRQCREQIGLSIEQAKRKLYINTLGKIELGDVNPTFNQLQKLASVYHVPQWVFLRETLPKQYDFSRRMPAFRQFADASPVFADHKVRVITASVEQFRELILELRIDMDEAIEPFSPPNFIEHIPNLAQSIKEWLGLTGLAYPFEDWKKACEDKDIFIFLTSKYSSWSKVEPSLFRGFSIYKEKLPIIVINDSDARAAQSFTLFHEIGHLLRKESIVDATMDDIQHGQDSEVWCNKFAGEMLMPKDAFTGAIQGLKLTGQVNRDIISIDERAKTFEVSSHAFAVRLLQLNKINQQQYNEIASYLIERYRAWKEQQGKANTPIRRNMAKEKLRQYGNIYSKTIVQAYRDQEISLHKLCKSFGFKKVSDAITLKNSV